MGKLKEPIDNVDVIDDANVNPNTARKAPHDQHTRARWLHDIDYDVYIRLIVSVDVSEVEFIRCEWEWRDLTECW